MRRGIVGSALAVGSALVLGLVLVGAQAAPALNNQSASAAHLIGYWKFNEGTGTTAADSSGPPRARPPVTWPGRSARRRS